MYTAIIVSLNFLCLGYDFEETYVHEIEEPSKLNFDSERGLPVKKPGILPGFRPASNSDYQLER